MSPRIRPSAMMGKPPPKTIKRSVFTMPRIDGGAHLLDHLVHRDYLLALHMPALLRPYLGFDTTCWATSSSLVGGCFLLGRTRGGLFLILTAARCFSGSWKVGKTGVLSYSCLFFQYRTPS